MCGIKEEALINFTGVILSLAQSCHSWYPLLTLSEPPWPVALLTAELQWAKFRHRVGVSWVSSLARDQVIPSDL